jgi:hypothetical protein
VEALCGSVNAVLQRRTALLPQGDGGAEEGGAAGPEEALADGDGDGDGDVLLTEADMMMQDVSSRLQMNERRMEEVQVGTRSSWGVPG